MSYEGSHVLPESWWESLLPLARAMWKKTFRKHEGSDAAALVAWDRIRSEWVRDSGSWIMKEDLPGYHESEDGRVRIWMGQDGDWVAPALPTGSLELPGNYRIAESEIVKLPEEARTLYAQSYKLITKDGVCDPHTISCNVVRAEYKKTKDGWTKRSDHEKQQARLVGRLAPYQVQYSISDEISEYTRALELQHFADTEYSGLPDFLKEVYKDAYRVALRHGTSNPVENACSRRISTKPGWIPTTKIVSG